MAEAPSTPSAQRYQDLLWQAVRAVAAHNDAIAPSPETGAQPHANPTVTPVSTPGR